MKATSKRPTLPAPTDSEVSDNNPIEQYKSEVSTELSHTTDRTHYSVPDDGREIRVPTKKIKGGKLPVSTGNSQTSLLIEYYETQAGKTPDDPHGRSGVRVKVTPHARRVKAGEVRVTDIGNSLKTTHQRQVRIDPPVESRGPPVSFNPSLVEYSNLSPQRSDLEIMGHQSELSELPAESNVSSMPGDSIIDEPIRVNEPETRRTESLDRNEEVTTTDAAEVGKLRAPDLAHSRSLSKERITRKALEKIAREQSPEPVKPRKLQKNRAQSSGSDQVEEALKSRSRRSSNSHRESSDLKSYTGSSLLPPRDNDSNLSGGSKVSLNNPRLLATVEDAIKRLILPEIEMIKRNQSVRSTRTRDSDLTEDSLSRSGTGHRLSKATSEPYVKGRHSDETSSRDDRRRRKHKKSSREVDSDATSSRRDSFDSVAAEKERIKKKSKTSSRTRDKDPHALTRGNLKSHTSRSSMDEKEHRHSSGRKHSSKTRSQDNSIAETEEEYYKKNEIPPMPMNSEIQDSDLTRTSLLSAETAGTEDAHSVAPAGDQSKTKAVGRDAEVVSPVSSKTARQVKSQDSRDLKRSRSDRSISSKHSHKAAALAAAGLGGAAGGLYGYKAREHSRPSSRRSSGDKRIANRDHSPARSSAKTGRETASRDVDTLRFDDKKHKEKVERPPTTREMSKDSVQTTSTTEYPVTSKRSIKDKRHEPLNYSEPELMQTPTEPSAEPVVQGDEADEDAEEFYQHQHELNERYRTSVDEDLKRESGNWLQGAEETPNASVRDSVDAQSLGPTPGGQQIRGVGANPKLVDEPHWAESAVASLINQSMVSEQSGPMEAGQAPELHHKQDIDNLEETREIQSHEQDQHDEHDEHLGEPLEQSLEDKSPWLHEHASTSAERWNAIRDHTQKISSGANTLSSDGGNNSPVKQQETHEVSSMDRPRMRSNAMPTQDDEMPAVGYGQDDVSDVTDPEQYKPRPDSIVEGPLGDEYENRGLWPYEPTPDLERRGGFIHPHDRDSRSIDSGVMAAMGAATGAGLGIGAVEAARSAKSSQPSLREQPSVSAASDDSRYARPQGPRQPPTSDRQYTGPSPNYQKDEGYISAAHPRSPSVGSPLSFSKPPPKLFDERDAKNVQPSTYQEPPSTYQGQPTPATPDDPFVNNDQGKRDRHLSVNSHGIPAEGYDAAMGTGLNNIESKDVVALMDHLTVRDAHRNARDTEILVTLVRSAAEMRNQFDELKNQVDMQGQLTRRHDTKEAKDAISKIMTGTRAAALSNNSGPLRSARFTASSAEREDPPPAKRKNIFKRALSGLGSRNEKDLNKMEDMLMQLLEDVEALRDAQASSLAGGSQAPTLPAKASLDSYERLRAAPSSGYEPDGQAGTSSTPNASGTFSPAHSRQSAHRMHSGYNVSHDAHNRISTVHEHPDENIPATDPRYENDDGMITPTQEAQNQRSGTAATAAQLGAVAAASYNTPPSTGQSRGLNNAYLTPNTPRTGDHKARQKSTSSSVFAGIPRISRWSKTTTSSAPRDSFQHDRFSDGSRSASDINVPAAGGDPYDARSPSPLLPQDDVPMDDPKYHANRQSLTLEHPQPRQGSTQRHQSHLESQAYSYARAPSEKSMSDRAGSPGSPSKPPDDIFGSEPGLAKNRFSIRRSSRGTSGDYGTPQSTGSGGYRPPVRHDEGPLVPSVTQTQAQHTPSHDVMSPEHRRDSLDSIEPSDTSSASYRRHDAAAAARDQHDDNDDDDSLLPEHTRQEWTPSPHTSPSDRTPSPHTSDDERTEPDHVQWPQHSIGMPLERPRSPYYPGAQLTTIEERYSLEQSRISSPMSRHQSVRSRDRGADGGALGFGVDEEDVGSTDTLGDGGSTPTGSPVKGEMRGNAGTEGRQVSGERKVTPSGPRAMNERRAVSGGSVGSVGRKPVAGRV
ncbi:MAG: hypothetical protein Q9162_004320 [Coniocarpon cinnabarinum]